MKFNSAICTSVEQSKHLLELGLKKETADMYRPPSWGGDKIIGYYAPNLVLFNDHFVENPNDLPAWSLHRLMEILSYTPELSDFATELQYDAMIIHIANAIEANIFNKDYLEEKK